jgi:hypothetical protein
MDDLLTAVVVAAATIVTQQLLAAYNSFVDDPPTRLEKRRSKKRKRLLTPYKRNLFVRYSQPTTNLETIPVLSNILQDVNRSYMKNTTHLHPWQFFILADQCKDFILCPRLRRDGTRPDRLGTKKAYHDHYHRLFFALKWLNDGVFFRTRETEVGWGKSSIHDDCAHLLIAIIEGLHDQLQWPDEDGRRELADVFKGVFKNCIGLKSSR